MNARQAGRITAGAIAVLSTGMLLAGCASGVSVSSGGDPANPSFKVSGPGGSIEGGSTLPTDWPSDVPTPTQIPLKQAVSINLGMTAIFQGPGDIQAIQADLASRFAANGFTTSSSFGVGSAEGGIAVYEKGGTKVQVTAAVEGGNAVISEGVFFTNSASPKN